MEPNQNTIRIPDTNTPTPNNLPNIENVPEPPKENLMAAGTKEKKGGKGMLIGLILCLLLATGGIGFGVWAMMDRSTTKDNLNAQIVSLKAQNSELLEQAGNTVIDEDAAIISTGINNNLAQNLIAPYIGAFNYLSNIFDYNFSEDVKVEIAYKNLGPAGVMNDIVPYWELNDEYRKLFGGDLEKRDYGVGHSDSFAFSANNDNFTITQYAGGGAGAGMFSVVKDAHYSNNDVLVNVYHDVLPVCGATDEEYCIESNGSGIVVDSIEQANVKDLISNFSNNIPVYKMTFVVDDGHYILKSVEKEA